MDPNKRRFTLGRQSSMAPADHEGSNSVASLPEQLGTAMQLLFEASNGNIDGIKQLIGQGVDVNVADFDDRTALHVAACEGHVEVVKLLVENGANVNARDRWGSTPLLDAKHYSNKEVCDFLQRVGAKVPEVSKRVPMQVANPADVPEYEVNPKDLNFMKNTAEFSMYRVAKWHGIQVFVKEIPLDLSNQPQIVASFRAELALLQKLRHPNIVQFLGAVTQSTPMRIILEFCEGGDLHFYLRKKGQLDVGKAVVFALDIARGLNYIHEWKPEAIMHRNLKPRNILRDRVGRLKVADFHLGQILKEDDLPASDAKDLFDTSRHYMAPEILRGDAFDKSVDVYSFSMILYQMVEGCLPFEGKNIFDEVVKNNNRPSFKMKSKRYPDGLRDGEKLCLIPSASGCPQTWTL
ncbi:hypothetical protein KP509_38G043200 [Ceratopteris richardii]|uniref:Protein kinase domain-containing protein n=1 Tax=Ceratopteris richardii TaxID=49495 RepID=A0A8T2Q4B4_CERRI|nr:hypothetical protein KP509_38G043200 [Ceratopteris richardii]